MRDEVVTAEALGELFMSPNKRDDVELRLRRRDSAPVGGVCCECLLFLDRLSSIRLAR